MQVFLLMFLLFACQEDDTRSQTFVMDNDELAILLGTDKGANPVEYLLVGLSGLSSDMKIQNADAPTPRTMTTKARWDRMFRQISHVENRISPG